MLGEGGLAAEALLTALDRALVWALASVDPAVSRQAGRIREAFSAAKVFALVRLLSSVGTDVYSQGAALDEGLATIAVVADVWALIGMYAVVTLQIRLAVETLDALEFGALEGTLAALGNRLVLVVDELQNIHFERGVLFFGGRVDVGEVLLCDCGRIESGCGRRAAGGW